MKPAPVLLALLAFLALCANEAAHAATLLIRPARVWSEGEPIHPGWVVLVEGERIAAVGPAEAVRAPADAAVVDLPGETLIPGLMDLHSTCCFTPTTRPCGMIRYSRNPFPTGPSAPASRRGPP
jgi:imidazolonepropionase-like amidohydrolase